MHADKISFSQVTKASRRDLGLSGFNVLFGLKDEKVKTASVDSRLYDGMMSVEGRLDLSGRQAVLDLDAAVHSVTAAKLDSLVKQFGTSKEGLIHAFTGTGANRLPLRGE